MVQHTENVGRDLGKLTRGDTVVLVTETKSFIGRYCGTNPLCNECRLTLARTFGSLRHIHLFVAFTDIKTIHVCRANRLADRAELAYGVFQDEMRKRGVLSD